VHEREIPSEEEYPSIKYAYEASNHGSSVVPLKNDLPNRHGGEQREDRTGRRFRKEGAVKILQSLGRMNETNSRYSSISQSKDAGGLFLIQELFD